MKHSKKFINSLSTISKSKELSKLDKSKIKGGNNDINTADANNTIETGQNTDGIIEDLENI